MQPECLPQTRAKALTSICASGDFHACTVQQVHLLGKTKVSRDAQPCSRCNTVLVEERRESCDAMLTDILQACFGRCLYCVERALLSNNTMKDNSIKACKTNIWQEQMQHAYLRKQTETHRDVPRIPKRCTHPTSQDRWIQTCWKEVRI